MSTRMPIINIIGIICSAVVAFLACQTSAEERHPGGQGTSARQFLLLVPRLSSFAQLLMAKRVVPSNSCSLCCYVGWYGGKGKDNPTSHSPLHKAKATRPHLT